MSSVSLYTPTIDELDYRRRLCADEDTMSYNVSYGDNGGGTYDISDLQVREWYAQLIVSGIMFYAYIIEEATGLVVGEVNLRFDEQLNAATMGVVIHSKYRGRGFAEPALQLLIDVAFGERGFDKVIDSFPQGECRAAAERVFAKLGFVREGDLLVLTRDRHNNFAR